MFEDFSKNSQENSGFIESDKNDRCFTWWSICICDNISFSSS